MEEKKTKKSKYKYLLSNIALFSISNFVSKILVFLLVPFYTNVLTTAQYGIADIMQTTLLLTVPALTINMGEAALRFGIERSDKRNEILRIGIKYTLLASLIAGLLSFGLGMVLKEERNFFFIFILLFLTNAFYEFLVLFFQGCEEVKIVVSGSIISTLVLILSNLFLLLVIKAGLYGYIASQILAFFSASLLMLGLGKKYVPYIYHKGEKDKTFEKELLSYGGPMIAYSTGAWINNASDRYLVSLLCGVAVNGVYGVAYKIPAILTVFQRIFAQSWQMSATKSYKEEESGDFFSGMFKSYQAFMVIGCSLLILFVRAIAGFMFQKDFFEAWRFVPPLLISVVFGALTGFIGSICLAHKDSKTMGISTFLGAFINILLNLLLIPKYSAMGAAIATGISYYTMFAMSLFIVKKHVVIKHSSLKDHVAYLLLVTEAVVMIRELPFMYIVSGMTVLILLFCYLGEFKKILEIITGRFKRQRN